MLPLKRIIFIGGFAAILGITGCSTWGHHDESRSAGRVTDDKHLTSEIKDRLAGEPVYKFDHVDVKTFDGVVQLSGFVGTEEQKQHAATIAQTVPGVSRIVNGITVHEMITPTGRLWGTNQPQSQPPVTNQ
jgi:hyperosmotically inducible protein